MFTLSGPRLGASAPDPLFLVLSLAILSSWAPEPAQACATCGCTLSADAAMGYTRATGLRMSLEYDFINQNQLRSRYSPIQPTQVADLNRDGENQEVEYGTINRYLTAGATYSPTAAWNFSAFVPYIDRTHLTYGDAGPDQLNPATLSGAHSVGMGDVKLIAAYQGLLPSNDLGLQLGVKLPTGHFGGQNLETGAFVGRHPVTFLSGPAAGSALDTSLNDGNGSYDLILGAYYHHPVGEDLTAFVNGQFQQSVSHRLDQPGAEFRPGNQETASIGLRDEQFAWIVPQFQVNVNHKSPDQGSLADNTDTAGTVVYLSPGLAARFSQKLSGFAFVQRPVFSDLNGYQVFPHWTGSIGLSFSY